MRTVNEKIYQFHELDEKTQERVISKKIEEYQELFWLESEMKAELYQQLEKQAGIAYPDIEYLNLYYSLSYSQGDGVMFEIDATWNHNGQALSVAVQHSGRYYHSQARIISITDENGEQPDSVLVAEDEFAKVYESICDYLERFGYRYIESETSREKALDELNNDAAEYYHDGRLYTEN